MRLDDRHLMPAVLLCATAGIVDVIAFVGFGGFFASFMSGNSTRLAAAVARPSIDLAIAAALIASFVAGVASATMLDRHPKAFAALRLAGPALLVALSALLGPDGGTAALLLLAAAMGMLNVALGDRGIGLTYMTGTLVRLGKALGRRLAGGATGELAAQDLLLWTSFVAGGMIGAGLFAWAGMQGLWAAIATMGAAALLMLSGEEQAPAASSDGRD